MKLILASTSAYRHQLLQRLQLSFTIARPDIDESAHTGEAPAATAARLAAAKAHAVAGDAGAALIIGSDQVAALGTQVFGKPGSTAAAIAQLQTMRGQTVIFHTAVALLNTVSGRVRCEVVPTAVHMRACSDAEIERYVAREHVLDCAGSAKSEGLGISLLNALSGDDPTALVGLPLIALARMLRAEGVELP